MTVPPADLERRVKELVAANDLSDSTAFFGARFDAGLAWVHFPPGAGGLGLDATLQPLVEECLAGAGAPRPELSRNPIGLAMVAPTLAVHGTPEQRARFLRPLYTGEVWCQLFSEPGAGSDLAGLSTSAVRDGDEWIVNGQKVWTTLAHVSRYGILQARTNPDVPKHRGLTCFVVDMSAPGVEIRELRQMTGEAEFNEVYLTDVRIPDACRIGGEGDGWAVALTTLMNERVAIGTAERAPRGGGAVGVALDVYRAECRGAAERDRMARLWVDAEVVRLTNLRAGQLSRAGTPGPEGSVAKLQLAEINQAVYNFCLDLMGAAGALYPSGYDLGRPDEAVVFAGDVPRAFLRARANSIEGGTSEIMRNVLGERVLGLPGEPRVDRDLPWRQVPR